MSHVMQVLSPVIRSRLWLPLQQEGRMSYDRSSTKRAQGLTVCQIDNEKFGTSSVESSRRNFVTVASVATAGLFLQPDLAQAAKRKPPPPPEAKTPDEEKYLSAYDAKILANIRRKEGLKALVENQKAKAKLVREPDVPPKDIFGELPPSQSPPSESPPSDAPPS